MSDCGDENDYEVMASTSEQWQERVLAANASTNRRTNAVVGATAAAECNSDGGREKRNRVGETSAGECTTHDGSCGAVKRTESVSDGRNGQGVSGVGEAGCLRGEPSD